MTVTYVSEHLLPMCPVYTHSIAGDKAKRRPRKHQPILPDPVRVAVSFTYSVRSQPQNRQFFVEKMMGVCE